MCYQVPRISTFEQISEPRTQLPDPQSDVHFVERSHPGGRRPGTNASMQQAPAHWVETKAIMEA
jgi:hypothetical protein